jgi:hypothetical protein
MQTTAQKLLNIHRSSKVNPSPPKPTTEDDKEKRSRILKEAFDLIDSDKLGTITIVELSTFFNLLGDDLSNDDLVEILHSVGANAETGIRFDEFCILMGDIDLSDLEVHDVALKFVEQAEEKTTSFKQHHQPHKPLYHSTFQIQESERTENSDGIHFRGNRNARMQIAMLIDGTVAQAIVLGLILLDVVCVLCELLLIATICPCGSYPAANDDHSSYSSSYSSSTYSSSYSSSSSSSLDNGSSDLFSFPSIPFARELSASGGEACAKGDHQYSHSQYLWHTYLHWISISILLIFALQILLLVAAYRTKFFTVTNSLSIKIYPPPPHSIFLLTYIAKLFCYYYYYYYYCYCYYYYCNYFDNSLFSFL